MTCHNSNNNNGSPSENKAPDSETNSDSIVLRLSRFVCDSHDRRAKLDVLKERNDITRSRFHRL